MSYTIFTSNPAALIPQPGRAVNTFPSGLVRVDQTYLGLTSQATTHRATLAVGNDMPDGDSSPCIDGLKIFPEVQERRREDGFTEYIVSAYGRANSTGSEKEIFYNKKMSFGSLFYGGRQFERTYFTSSGPSAILTPPLFSPFFTIQNNDNVLGVYELSEGDTVTFSRGGPNSPEFSWGGYIPPIGPSGGIIVRIKTSITIVTFEGVNVSEDESHLLVTFNKTPEYTNHEQRNFGNFSEFITTYKPNDETVATEIINFYRLKVNGVEVS